MGEITKELAKREQAIEQGVVQMREALSIIYEQQLWKGEYGSFDQYCSTRWGWKKSFAYNQLKAHDVAARVSTIVEKSGVPKKESQLREVAKAPEEKQAEVVKKANEKAKSESREPTAKDYRDAVEQLEIPDQEIEYEVVDDDDDVLEPPPKSEAEIAIENGKIISQAASLVSQAKKQIKAIADSPGTELLVARQSSILRELDSARAAIVVTIPHAICPRCNGKGCHQCGNYGWVNSILARELSEVS